MVNQVLEPKHVAHVRALLELNWPARAIIDSLAGKNVVIGTSQVYRIKHGQQWKENVEPTQFRPGPRRALSERQVRQLVEEAKVTNPPTQKAMAAKRKVSRQLVQLELKRNGLKRLKKRPCHQLSETMMEKRCRRSWPLYLRLNNE